LKEITNYEEEEPTTTPRQKKRGGLRRRTVSEMGEPKATAKRKARLSHPQKKPGQGSSIKHDSDLVDHTRKTNGKSPLKKAGLASALKGKKTRNVGKGKPRRRRLG